MDLCVCVLCMHIFVCAEACLLQTCYCCCDSDCDCGYCYGYCYHYMCNSNYWHVHINASNIKVLLNLYAAAIFEPYEIEAHTHTHTLFWHIWCIWWATERHFTAQESIDSNGCSVQLCWFARMHECHSFHNNVLEWKCVRVCVCQMACYGFVNFGIIFQQWYFNQTINKPLILCEINPIA